MHFGAGLRSDLQQPITRLAGGAAVVTIRKRWSLDAVTRNPTIDLSFGPAGSTPSVVADENRALVERLLSSIRFRYISNHIHPTDLLRQEEENIRRGLFRRLGKSPSFSADQIEKIREAAESLMVAVTDELKASTARISKVELGTPKDWGELLWAFGLRMQSGSASGREAVLTAPESSQPWRTQFCTCSTRVWGVTSAGAAERCGRSRSLSPSSTPTSRHNWRSPCLGTPHPIAFKSFLPRTTTLFSALLIMASP